LLGDLFDQDQSGEAQFGRALVHDVINDVSSITKYIVSSKQQNPDEESDDGLTEEEKETNKEIECSALTLSRAPRGSILAFSVGKGDKISLENEKSESFFSSDVEKTKLKLYYPFFSSHFLLPVKPGEQVIVVTIPGISEYGFWMTRVHSELEVEDLNYTHFDRKYIEPGPPPKNKEKNTKLRKPGFPNGESVESSDPKFKPDDDDEDDFESGFIIAQRDGYETIKSTYKDVVTTEPVPRFIKRPGDTVIQGSNNSLIVLGTDRGYGLSNRPEEKLSNYKVKGGNVKPSQGSIDLVVGRGRILGDPKEGDGKENAALTRPRVIKNVNDEFELDKDPTSDESITSDISEKQKDQNRYLDVPEGDPDFINDAARIYVTTSGDIDDKLGTSPAAIPGPINGSSADSALSPKPDLSSVSAKADRIRIVARNTGTSGLIQSEYKDVKISDGDVRIIKQGKAGEDASCIYMMSDGSIQVSGKVIMMGRSEDTMAEGVGYGGKGPADGGLHPYVRFADLKKVFTELFTALDAFTTTMQTHVTPGFGSPSPQLTQAAVKLQSDLLKIDTESMNFDALASKRIFGE